MTFAAKDIYQTFLDHCSKLLFDREFEPLAAMMVYPHVMETLDGALEFHEPQMMVEAGQEFRDYLERMQTRDYFRLCKTAEFIPGRTDQIIGTHETYMLQAGGYVFEPLLNRMSLECEDGIWKGAGIRCFIDNSHVPVLSPKHLRERALAQDEHIARGELRYFETKEENDD